MGGKLCLKELLTINPKVKVIIATGHSLDAPTKDGLQAGAKGFVAKPYKTNELLQTVRTVLDQR